MTDRAESVFEQACDLDSSERRDTLDRLCGDDDGLRAEVESLLQSHDAAGQFLNEPTIDPSDSQGPIQITTAYAEISEGPGSVVDRYKLLEKIGEGGFGVVYMAQQSVPIRRRVALKIIKLGMDTKQVVTRFEAERQALAMMDHPNIARVIDGGSTETGRPYFVMELVRGDPITTFCDQKRLSLRLRLELFQQVCRAVEHAHQKGIIHRDIKPSNVLVTISDDKPVVKVIDFGIAKATNCELTEKTLFTEFRQLIGTPQYMSPEQAERSGVDIDTRTDVYSLGVLLYEMLSGRTPLDPKKLNSAAWGELQRMIVEDEPTKPSVMVSSSLGEIAEVAKRRSTEPTRLGTLLRGDLDWIVLKAIEKDRSRRYSTASHFAADIDRFLNDEAVEASPPSKVYQLGKFARRNRALLTTAAVVLLALVAGLIATSTAATWAYREQKVAERARSMAEKEAHSMRRAATLAGASMILPEPDARRLAQDWKDEIAEMQSKTGTTDADAVMLETQYTTWYANWLLNHRRADEAAGLIDACYDRTREVIGVDDPTFLALCNVRIIVNELTAADRQQNARTFGDLILSLEAIQGEDEAAELSPQYAAALVDADRNEEAAEAVGRYLAYRSRQTTPPSANENARLDKSIDQMMNSSRSVPELIRQLTSVRETGGTTAAVPSVANDEELQQDLETFQGRWEHKRWARGKIAEHMIVEFDGQSTTTQWVEDGKPGRGRRGRFVLSRSGGAKVMTNFLGASNAGLAFIYHLQPNRFSNVSGMLTNHDSLPNVEFREWYRIKDEAEPSKNDSAADADGK